MNTSAPDPVLTPTTAPTPSPTSAPTPASAPAPALILQLPLLQLQFLLHISASIPHASAPSFTPTQASILLLIEEGRAANKSPQ